jgi:hypothetical protein
LAPLRKSYFIWKINSPSYTTQVYTYNLRSKSLTLIVPQNDVGNFSFSSNERYLALKGACDQGCIVDVASGKTSKLDLKYPIGVAPTLASEFIWHPAQDWVLAFGFTLSPFVWINVANADVSVQREIGECNWSARSCFGWLPELEAS